MNRGAAGLGGGRLQFMGSQRDMAERLSAPVHTHTHTHTQTHTHTHTVNRVLFTVPLCFILEDRE